MTRLSPLALGLSIFAFVLGAIWQGLIGLDDYLETHGYRTISARLLSLEWDGVVGWSFILTLVGTFAFVFCALGGHLWFYKGDHNYGWFAAWAVWCLAGLAGFYFGHQFFWQTRP